MTAALARTASPATARRPHGRRGVAPVALRVARPGERHHGDGVDLDAAWAEATAPHRVAAERDAHVAEVLDLDAARARRAGAPRVRRNRVAAVLFVLGLAVVLAMGAGALVADADGPTPVGQTVTVQPGDTLWDVAVAHTADGQDPRATLDRIRDLNGLTGTDVPAWTPVVLPASAG
jgi:hypothetical protein